MSSIGSFIPPEREKEIRQYIETRYGGSESVGDLPYYGAAKRVRGGVDNPVSAYIIATIAAFVLYHLDRKYDLVCSMVFNY